MPSSRGYNAKVAFVKNRGLYGAGPAIAYPDTPGATDLGANHLVPFLTAGVVRALNYAEDNSIIGQATNLPPDIVAELSKGPINHNFFWRSFERLMLCALGFEHPDDSPATIVAGAYGHVFEVDHHLDDEAYQTGERAAGPWDANDRKVRRGHLGVLKGGVADWVFSSVFVNGFTISGTPRDGVTIEFDFLPNRLYRGAADAYNSDAWARPGGSTARVLFHDSRVHFGLHAAGEGSMTPLRVSKWELKHDNKMRDSDQTTESGLYIEQPVRDMRPETMLSLEFPRFRDTDDTLLDYIDLADTVELIAKVELSGPEIAATGENYKWGFYLPNIKPDNVPYDVPVQGEGPLPQTWKFKAYDPSSDPFATNNYHGITLVKNTGLVVTTHNEDNINYLLET